MLPFWQPLLSSLLAGGATGLGGLAIVALGRVPSVGHLTFALALAGSVMITVSVFDLFLPFVLKEGLILPSITACAGVGAFRLISSYFPDPQTEALLPVRATGKADDLKDLTSSQARSLRLGMIMMAVLTAHNFPEGLAVSVSSVNSGSQGILVAFAIALHNIPEGLAIATPIYAATRNSFTAVGMAFASGLSEPLGALCSLLFLRPLFEVHPWAVDYVLVFVSGIMTAVAVWELIPEAFANRRPLYFFAGLFVGFIVMMASIQVLSAWEERPEAKLPTTVQRRRLKETNLSRVQGVVDVFVSL